MVVKPAHQPNKFRQGFCPHPVAMLAAARDASLGNAGAATEGRDPRLDFNASSTPTFCAAVEMSSAIHSASRRDGADSANQQRASLRITLCQGREIKWRLLSPRQKCLGFQRLNGTRRPGQRREQPSGRRA